MLTMGGCVCYDLGYVRHTTDSTVRMEPQTHTNVHVDVHIYASKQTSQDTYHPIPFWLIWHCSFSVACVRTPVHQQGSQKTPPVKVSESCTELSCKRYGGHNCGWSIAGSANHRA